MNLSTFFITQKRSVMTLQPANEPLFSILCNVASFAILSCLRNNSTNEPSSKNLFIPFVQERDHLGRLLKVKTPLMDNFGYNGHRVSLITLQAAIGIQSLVANHLHILLKPSLKAALLYMKKYLLLWGT